MRIVTYNIQYGRGKDDRINLPRIAEAIKGADVIALQEVERFWPHSDMVDQPAALANLLPEYFWVYGPFVDMDASIQTENGPVWNRRRQFGPMLLSRTPIVWSRAHLFPTLAATSHLYMDTGAIEGFIDTTVGPLRFYSLHLSAINTRERALHIQTLLDLHRSPMTNGAPYGGRSVTGGGAGWDAGEPMPVTSSEAVLLGDFNSEPHDLEYEMLVGPKDKYTTRVHHVDAFVDTWAAVHKEEAGEPTWIKPPYYRALPNRRIDY